LIGDSATKNDARRCGEIFLAEVTRVTRYKNIELEARLGSVIRHMNAVEEYREVL